MNSTDLSRPASAMTVGCRLLPRRACRWLLICCAVLLLAVAHGATFPDLYTVEVEVDPGIDRAQVERAAMTILLTRITGRTDAAFDPNLRRLVDGAGSAAYQASFALLGGGRFQVEFNATAVQRVLNEAGYPVWGPERPLTIVWVAVDGGAGERAVLGASDAGLDPDTPIVTMMQEIRASLIEAAYQRGLPLAFPLLDLEDMIAVEFADVWGGFGDRVIEATRRYQADAILLGRAWTGDFGTSVQWTLLKDGQRHFVSGTTPGAGVDWAADHFAAELSATGGARRTRIVVSGVDSLGDYGRVMRHLESTSLLEIVDVESYEHGLLRLVVTARGDAGVIERVLSLGGVLSSSGTAVGVGANAMLEFRVVRQGAGG